MKKYISLLLCCAALWLCACGSQEQTPEMPAAGSDTEAARAVNVEFTTDDGQIKISIHDDNADAIPAAMPVLRVRPKVITSDMARQMADGLFGEAELFEYSEELSKAEIADMIDVYEYAVTDESIKADHGADSPQSWIESVRDARLAILEYYRNAYAMARDEVTPRACEWKFYPMEHYAVHGFDYAGSDPYYTDAFPAGMSVDLRAVTELGGVPYEFWVNNNEREDFRNHSLSVFVLMPDSGGTAEERKVQKREWYMSMGLYSDTAADESALDSACAQAVKLADEMGLGEWRFTAAAVDRTESTGEGWQIEVTGMPVYEGYPVNWQSAVGVECYPESLTIRMANSGVLIELQYTSPMEIMEATEQAAALKTWEDMEPLAMQAMRGLSYETLIPSYSSEKEWWDSIGAVITEVRLDIDSVCVGYIRVPCDGEDFLLVPSLSFPGRLHVTGSIPGVHESPMELLDRDGDGYNVSLDFDLRDGGRIG